MDKKTPADFNNHDEWLSYARDDVPVADRAYALACGRTELFKNFYKVRKQAFPVQFTNEMERIPLLDDPERTNQLESLNERIFASLTELLFNQAQPRIVEAEAVVPASPREQVAELFDRYNLHALPVVDEQNHLVGVVNADHVISFLRQQA